MGPETDAGARRFLSEGLAGSNAGVNFYAYVGSNQINLSDPSGLCPHKHEKMKRWLSRHPRFHMHFTPTGCSWLNMVEQFFET